MMNKKRLIAYIKYEDENPFIDIVEISKKGTSYLYNGQRWHRVSPIITGCCKNDEGKKLEINPLNRNYNHYKEISASVAIKDRAADHYRKWINGVL